jgi:hypothetical protein
MSRTVEIVLARIKRGFRDFQNSAKPPAPPRPKRLTKLERDLASWFGVGPKGRPPPPTPNPAPISLRPYGPHIHMDGESLRATGHIEIALTADSEGSEVPFRVRLSLKVAEEDGVSSTDPVPLSITPQCALEALGEDFWLGSVSADAPAHISFESAPYDPSWTVQFVPEVLPVEEETT